MIVFLLIWINLMLTSVKGYNESTTEESSPNSQHIWHSYTFNTGAGNREELYISNVELNRQFESVNGIFAWKSLQMEKQVAVIGLGNDFLMVTLISGENNSFTYKYEIHKQATCLTVFQKWNAESQGMESFVIVATASTEENYTLLWYQILNKKLKFLWDWQYHGNITHLDVVKINYESKLIVVNQRGSTPAKASAEVYSFNMGHELDIWLFEKITLGGSPSSVTVFDSGDNVFFCASFPSLEATHIFRYSKSPCLDTLEKKHFVSHQQIFTTGLRSVTSFQVGFHWHLAVASSSSLIYHIGENLLFQPVDAPPLGDFNYWLAVPVDTYREDTILLADSGSDVLAVTLTGDKHLKVIGGFTRLACADDLHCSEKMKRIALNESTAFTFNGHQSVIMSGKNEFPLFFKLLVKLKPQPDKAIFKLKEVLNTKNILERDYANQNEQISELLSDRDPPEIEAAVLERTAESKRGPAAASQTKGEGELSAELNGLKAALEALDVRSRKLLAALTSFPSQGENLESLLAGNVSHRLTFYGSVLINELNVSTINGLPVDELLADSFRRDRVQKIGGEKKLSRLSADNVIFERLGDIQACDIVFSDDSWESENKNIVKGDVIWENKLTVLGDVKILRDGATASSPSVKAPRGTLRPLYEALSLKELEVSEDLHVERSINGQPIILPVRGADFKILDVVSQARFEVVNVKQNLEVELINGKNYSAFVESLLSPSPRSELDSIRVEGLFSAPSIAAEQVNNIELAGGVEGATEELLEEGLDASASENELKRSQNEQLKRVIHVFENVEIEGILFSNKINNISWAVLNDTVKKSERTVALVGTKTFKKPLKAEASVLDGTMNGRFVDHVLTNFSNQTLRHPQAFENAVFKNLTLKGAWDGTFVNQLNESLVRLSSSDGHQTNLTFQDECALNALNVTHALNDADLNDSAQRPAGGKAAFKSIRAGHVVVHGSLITNNQINNVNLTNFNMVRVSLKSPEAFDRDIYQYNVTVSGDLNVETLNLNDVSSVLNAGGDTKLIEKLMNGEIQKMKKLLVKGNITTARGVNGFDLRRVFGGGVRITKQCSLKGNVTFENIVYFDNINVTHSIDGFPLKALEQDIAFRHSHVFLTGPKNFSAVRVTKSMRARTLNGHLTQEILSSKGDHTVKGPVQINGDVVVRGNVTSYSAINGVTVPDLLRTYSTRFSAFVHSGDLTLTSEEVTVGSLVVGGRIQNASLSDVIADSVRKDDGVRGLLNVTGRKAFKGEVRFRGNVAVRGLIHGVDLAALRSDVALINKPTKLRGSVTIQESVLKDLETAADFNSSLINNIDTNDWLEDCIPLDRYEVVSGEKTFEQAHALQDVSADFVNGHLPSAMISLHKKQHIPVPALFPRIHATSDIAVEGLVNGRNLRTEFEDSVMLTGPQTVSGKTVFDAEFVVNGTLLVDSLRGKPVDSLITLDTEQVIRTPLEFRGLVKARQGVEDLALINDINVTDWKERSVSLNGKQVVSGLWTVKGKVRTKNVEGEGLLHSVSLASISKDIEKGRLTALEMKNATELEYSAQCRKVHQLSQQLSSLPLLLDQFEMVCEIETPTAVDSVITFKIGAEDNLVVTFVNECLSALYRWNKDNATFDYKRQMNIGPVSKWMALNRGKATYLVTSSSSSRTCEENLQRGNVWLFKADVDGYTHLLSTGPFVDIAQESSAADEFFTIDADGVVQQWRIQENGNLTFRHLTSFGPENYRFVDSRIMGGLTVSNGRELKYFVPGEEKVVRRQLPVANSHIVALPLDGRVLTAAVLKDKIIVYEDLLQEKVYSVVHTYRAGSALWFSYGPQKQAFLIVASHHKLIEVYEYKSVSGLVKKLSIQMFSSRLQSVDLPVRDKYQQDKFVIVIQKKKLAFVRAEMFGDCLQEKDFRC